MEEKLENLRTKLEKVSKQIEEAPGWGAYVAELADKQRVLLKEIAYWEKKNQSIL